MGDKKKHRDRSDSRDKKKSKKKSKQDKGKDRKDKKDKKKRQRSSSSSSQSSSSDSSRSREKRSKKKKDKGKQKQKSKDKQQKSVIHIPFAMQPTISIPAPPNPLNPIRPIGGMIIPPPAPPANILSTALKPKTKQSHIFRLLPRLPLGAVTIAKTIYCSSFMNPQFQKQMYVELCDSVQKVARAEGAKKAANMIPKAKNQILQMKRPQAKKEFTMFDQQREVKNQFKELQQSYNLQMKRLKQQFQHNLNKIST